LWEKAFSRLVVPMVQAAIYVRISRARRELLDAQRQVPPCEAFCAQQGWTVAKVYIDDNRSAYKRNVHRDDFERMLADVRAGHIDAIVTWQADRLLRTVEDASAIISIAKHHGTVIANVGGTIDLSTASGRKRFYDLAVAAEYESDLSSERLKLKHAELAADGKWEGGMRNFGHDLQEYVGQDANGRSAIKYKLVLNPKESAALATAAAEVIGGRSHTAIAKQWNKQGLTTTTGKPFSPQKVRELLLSPKTAGLRYVDGKPVTAAWEGIITLEQHQELRAILGPTRRERAGTGLPTARTYLLGGLVFCGKCGHRLTAKRSAGKRRYYCDSRLGGCGGILRAAEPLERWVVRELLSELPQRLLEAANRAPEHWESLGRLMAQRQTQEDRLDGLADYLADGTLSKADYLRQKKRLQARLDELEAQITSVRSSAPRRRLRGAYLWEIEAEWEQLDLDEQRSLLADHIDKIVVKPVGRGRHRITSDSVEITWRSPHPPDDDDDVVVTPLEPDR
jgi:DNA invertase Pin-like site-specific DNA recombinase